MWSGRRQNKRKANRTSHNRRNRKYKYVPVCAGTLAAIFGAKCSHIIGRPLKLNSWRCQVESVGLATEKCMAEGPSRMSVETELRFRARRLHEQAVRLEALADRAAHMDSQAEQALYDLLNLSR